jgi:YaiO family outer membrane protein
MRRAPCATLFALAVCLHGGALAGESSSLRGLKPPTSSFDAITLSDTLSSDGGGLKRTESVPMPALGRGLLFSGGLVDERRFTAGDLDYRYTLHQPAGQNIPALAEPSVHTLHDLLPRYTLHTQVNRALPGGWGVGFGVRQSDYNFATTNLLSFSAEHNWGGLRGAYTLYSNRAEGVTFGGTRRLELSYSYGDRNVVGLSYTTGRDIDYAGVPMMPYSADVRDWTFSGRHWVSPNWALTYDVLQQDLGPLYRRSGLRLGVSRSF